MTQVEVEARGITPQMVRDFIATYDCSDPQDRRIRKWLLARLYSEMYWREREWYPEWVDLGGES